MTDTNDNPFAEPDDDDRTVIRPLPGGRAPLAAPDSASRVMPHGTLPGMPQDAFAPDAGFRDLAGIGLSPILDAAAPLLSLLARLRNTLSVPDPQELRQHTVVAIRRFEEILRGQGLPAELIRAAHYAVCASLDDVVRNTPWGSRGAWARISLVAEFHGEVRSGERFFDMLAQHCRNQGRFLPVIELMYVCMSLGMQGRYRLSPHGPAELDRVREETYALLMRQRRPAERALSPHWQGVSAPYRPLRASLPVWVAAIGGAGLLGLLYVLLSFHLNDASDRLFETALALPPGHVPVITRAAPPLPLPPIPPQPAGVRDRLRQFLAPEIGQDLVSIAGTDAAPILRIQAGGLFRSGSAAVEPKLRPLLVRIAGAIQTEPGRVEVIGYTDNQPIHTVAFPSNFQLSAARAGASAAVIAAAVDPARIPPAWITVEGRADADPIAPNDTSEGRERNRRIEMILHRTGTD